MDYHLGIDIGTSSIKAVAFATSGRQLSVATRQCQLFTPQAKIAELCANKVLNDVVESVGECVACLPKDTLKSIGFSCQMHSIVCVGDDGEVLNNAMTWADTRAQREAREIADNTDIVALHGKTGCRIDHPMYPLSKILWLKNNKPQLFVKTSRFVTIKEFVLYHLYGVWVVDYTLAASQGYFDIHNNKWCEELLMLMEITPAKLSTPVPCDYVLPDLKANYAEKWCVNGNIVSVVGTGDGIAANLGCAGLESQHIISTIGTSGALRTIDHKPYVSEDRATWCYNAVADTWCYGGAINNGGIVLSWLQNNIVAFFSQDTDFYKWITENVANIPPTDNNPFFWPHLLGERSPDWNDNATGVMYNIRMNHDIRHMVRAALEGVIYQMYAVYKTLKPLKTSRMIACGGYIHLPLWLQIQADVFDCEIDVSPLKEASALGAAFIAMYASGAVRSMAKKLDGVKVTETIAPGKNREVYQRLFTEAREQYEHFYFRQHAR